MRLYEGNGGATTAFRYSVTTRAGLLSPERQVPFACAAPVLKSVACDGDGVRIAGESSSLMLPQPGIDLPRARPRTFWRGAEQDMGTEPLTVLRMARRCFFRCLRR